MLKNYCNYGIYQSANIATPWFPSTRSSIYYRKYSRCRLSMMPEGPEVQNLVNQIQQTFRKYENNHNGDSKSSNIWQLTDFKILSGRYVKAPLEGLDDLKALLPLDFIDIKSKGKFIYFNLDKVTIFSTLGLKGHWQVIDSNVEHTWNYKFHISKELNNTINNTIGSAPISYEKRFEIGSRSANNKYQNVRLALKFTLAFQPQQASTSTITNFAATPSNSNLKERVKLIPNEIILAYYDSIGYGTLKIVFESTQLDDKLERLGPDWISNPISLAEFKILLSKSSTKKRYLAVFLMDQTKTSGIGNYILSEVLYFSKLYPWIKCQNIPDETIPVLYDVIIKVCKYSYLSQASESFRYNKHSEINTKQELFESLEVVNDTINSSGSLDVHVPYPFIFSVYTRTHTSVGYQVMKDVGPHKRAVYWVPEVQTIGNDGDKTTT